MKKPLRLTFKSCGPLLDYGKSSLRIKTLLIFLGNSSIKFAYKVLRDKEILAEAYTVNVFIDKEMNPVRIPDEVRDIL